MKLVQRGIMMTDRESQGKVCAVTTAERFLLGLGVTAPTLFLWFNHFSDNCKLYVRVGVSVSWKAKASVRWVGWWSWTNTHTQTHSSPTHCVYSGSPSCGAQHGSRVCTAATLARPRRMHPPLWSPRHQRHEPVCSPKHERHLALCPQPSLTLMRAVKEKEGVCVFVCVCLV